MPKTGAVVLRAAAMAVAMFLFRSSSSYSGLLVHASAGPPISVAIPFCPKDLVPLVGAPVHCKCGVVIEWACKSLFCYVCELPESLIHLRGSGPVVLYLDLPKGFVIFDLCSISVPAHEGIQFLGKGTCLQLPHNLWFICGECCGSTVGTVLLSFQG